MLRGPQPLRALERLVGFLIEVEPKGVFTTGSVPSYLGLEPLRVHERKVDKVPLREGVVHAQLVPPVRDNLEGQRRCYLVRRESLCRSSEETAPKKNPTEA